MSGVEFLNSAEGPLDGDGCSVCSSWTLSASRALLSLNALWSLRAYFTLDSLRALLSLNALRALWAGFALRALRAGGSCRTGGACRTGLTLNALRACLTLNTLDSLFALRTSRANRSNRSARGMNGCGGQTLKGAGPVDGSAADQASCAGDLCNLRLRRVKGQAAYAYGSCP